MTDQELSNALDAKGAVIVHFSHHVHMNAEHPLYPEDLQRVLAQNGDFPLSCCALWPRHAMDLVGSIGVVFKPTLATVLSVSAGDSGSMEMSDGSEGSLGTVLTRDSFEASFDVENGCYNEWRVLGAAIEGIFVADPDNIFVKCEVEVGEGEWATKTTSQRRICLSDVFNAFKGQRFFTLGPGGRIVLNRA